MFKTAGIVPCYNNLKVNEYTMFFCHFLRPQTLKKHTCDTFCLVLVRGLDSIYHGISSQVGDFEIKSGDLPGDLYCLYMINLSIKIWKFMSSYITDYTSALVTLSVSGFWVNISFTSRLKLVLQMLHRRLSVSEWLNTSDLPLCPTLKSFLQAVQSEVIPFFALINPWKFYIPQVETLPDALLSY